MQQDAPISKSFIFANQQRRNINDLFIDISPFLFIEGGFKHMTKNYFSLQWHITDRCDQRCKHCYIFAGEDKSYSPEFDFAILKQIFFNYLTTCDKMDKNPSIAITGGDPLLHKDIWKLLHLFKEYNVPFAILGNPFHLDASVAKELKQLGCNTYQMSLDGLEHTHDFIRKPGSYKATLEKIQVLNEAGIKSAIATTVSKMNIDEIPELVRVAVEYKAKTFGFSRYCPNEKDRDNLVTPLEYRAFLEKMWEQFTILQNKGTTFILKDHLWKLFLYEKGLFKIEDNSELIMDGCHCGISHITILANGLVYACRRCESHVGNVLEESLYDIFFGSKMEMYRNFEDFEACANCELLRFCRGCPSVTKCATGNFYAKDPQCWKGV